MTHELDPTHQAVSEAARARVMAIYSQHALHIGYIATDVIADTPELDWTEQSDD